jgi:hypothetical protein
VPASKKNEILSFVIKQGEVMILIWIM